jgi:hypothetical protein
VNISNQRKGVRREINVTDVRVMMSVGILTAVTTKAIVLQDMTPCSFVTGTRVLGSLSLLSFPATSIFYPDYGCSFFLRNFGNEILGYKESHSRQQ